MLRCLLILATIAGLTACDQPAPIAPVAAGPGLAAPTGVTSKGRARVAICHRTSSPDRPWLAIEVAEPAVPAHMRHGDGEPGGSVPGMHRHLFDEDCVPVPDQRPVDCDALVFADPALDRHMRRVARLGPDDGPMNSEMFANVTAVVLTGSGIRSLDGLQCMPHLDLLSLPENEISDLTPLAGAHTLRIVALASNQISDLTPLAELPLLRDIRMRDNQIESLAPLMAPVRFGGIAAIDVRDNPLDCDTRDFLVISRFLGTGLEQNACPVP